MKEIRKKIMRHLNRVIPVSQAKYLETMKNMALVVDGLSCAESQCSQMIMSMTQDMERLKAAMAQQQEEKPANKDRTNNSYA
jgi:hypothetical protein